MNKKIIKIIAGSLILSAGVYGLFVSSPIGNTIYSNNDNYMVDNQPLMQSGSTGVADNPISNVDAFIQMLSTQMKDKHSHDIHLVNVQISMGDFRHFVLEQFPEHGEAAFRTIMINAFPEYAQQIFNVLDKMAMYSDWHIDMLLTLNEMDVLTRNGTLWGKRRELFGDLAEEIWQEELDNAEQKQKSVQETLAVLQVAKNVPMLDRLNMLTDSIQEQYGDEYEDLLISKGMVADIYFNLDSVQYDLKNMSVSERADALAASRRQLGFSEASILEMAKKDESNEARWKNGNDYMSARDQLTQVYSGNVLTEKLAELRSQYFKHEALTIEKEEKNEFFRYKRPRLYGSN